MLLEQASVSGNARVKNLALDSLEALPKPAKQLTGEWDMKIIEGKIYKTSEILEILQMSRPTLYKAIEDKKIRSIGVRQVRIIGKELKRFLER